MKNYRKILIKINSTFSEAVNLLENSQEKLLICVNQKQKFHTMDITQASLDMVVNLDLDLGNICNLKCRICNWTQTILSI